VLSQLSLCLVGYIYRTHLLSESLSLDVSTNDFKQFISLHTTVATVAHARACLT